MKEDRAEMKKIMTALVIEEKREETAEIHSISNSIPFFLRSIFSKHTRDRAKNSYNLCSFNL